LVQETGFQKRETSTGRKREARPEVPQRVRNPNSRGERKKKKKASIAMVKA